MKTIFVVILGLATVGAYAAPTTTGVVTHPTTPGGTPAPRTNVVVEHPKTGVKVLPPVTSEKVVHPTTTVVVTHPTTPGISSTATAKGTPEPKETKVAALSTGSYTPSYKNAKPLGNKATNNTPSAAKLVKGESGLGQMTGKDTSERDTAIAKDAQHKAEMDAKKAQNMQKALGNLKGVEGTLQKEIDKAAK